MKSQTKKNNSSKILEINLTRNLKKGGTVQWDSNQKLKKAEKQKRSKRGTDQWDGKQYQRRSERKLKSKTIGKRYSPMAQKVNVQSTKAESTQKNKNV